MKRQALLVFVLVLPPLTALAQFQAVTPPRVSIPEAPPAAPGGSNMPPGFYPGPRCEKPAPLPKPPDVSSDAMAAYNARVRSFNQRAGAFNACMKTYVDNAQADIQRIQDIVHAAVSDANGP